MQTIYWVKELGPLITNKEKILQNFEIFEKFLGSKIFEISQIRISLWFNRSQTKTSAYGRCFMLITTFEKKFENFQNFENLGGCQKKFFQKKEFFYVKL